MSEEEIILGKIRLVTDSTADLPKDALADVVRVPLKVHFGEETFLDGVTIEEEEFYARLANTETLPTTSQPSPADFVDTYRKIKEEDGDDVQIISIHLSAALSGTVQSAKLAQDMLADELDITVIDSKLASYGIGMIVTEVYKAIRAGKNKEECVALAERLISNTGIFFLVDTLEYLQKGGRIGRAAAVVGSLLNIKPILGLTDDGEVQAIDKVRGNKKATLRLLEAIKAFASGRHVQLAICHAQTREQAESLKQRLMDEFKVEHVTITDIGPVIGTHVGPNTLGVIVSRME